MKLTVLVLTFNEELHLARCLQSILPLTNDIVVVDCFSQDQTIAIAKQYGARVLERAWENNHSTQVNWALTQLPADTEWVMRIDADEYLKEELIANLHLILQQNPTIDVFLLPRINTIEGLTQKHIDLWRWNLNEKGWVNFPDLQTRILQNSPKINWVNKVHEVLIGHNTYSFFPLEEDYCLIHPKTIQRQEKQNTLYNLI